MTYKLYLGDCLDFMRTLDANSIDAVVTDPPYFKVLDDDWDNAWKTRDEFLAWLGQCLDEFKRALKHNGSLFLFAFPDMAAFVKVEVWKRFHVLNHIVWEKRNGGVSSRACKEELRSFLQLSERVIFAEQYNSDNAARGESGYTSACDRLHGFVFEPLRAYLKSEWERAGLKPDDANIACGTASMAGRHFFSVSQWCLPTEKHYNALREYANSHDNKGDYLRREYDDLRREYDDLRREYDDLRRPFAVSVADQYTDVWTFNTSATEGTLHPAQKPISMMIHIVKSATRTGDTILDPFMGSGTTGVACMRIGRNFIGCEIDPTYYAIAERRISQAAMQPPLFSESKEPAPEQAALPLSE